MTQEDMIAQYIASHGVTKCPPAIVPYGWTAGLKVANPSEEIHLVDKSKSRIGGFNAARMRSRDNRRKDIADAYRRNPCPDTVLSLADLYGTSISAMARMIRESGFRDVRTSARKGGWSWASTEERTDAIFDLLNAAAEKGEECPSNQAISMDTGMGESTISENFKRLSDDGKIKVYRTGNFRVVTITSSGMKTKRPAKMRP